MQFKLKNDMQHWPEKLIYELVKKAQTKFIRTTGGLWAI